MTDTTEAPRQEARFVIGAFMVVMLLSSLSQTIISAALPTIVGELGGLNYLAWIVTAYILAMTVVTPIYGKLGDLLGRKVVLQFAIVVFLVGSVLCGLAQSTTELIIFRAIQGLGGGGLMVSSMAAVGDVVSPRERGRYQGYFGAVFGVSTVIGPLIGGYIVEHTTWRWIFYVNIPVGLVALAVIAFAFAPVANRGKPKIDYAGAIFLAVCLTALVLATSIGGHAVAWLSAPVLLLAVVAAGGLIGLIVVERRAEEPILPLDLFTNRTFCIASATCFIVGLAMFAAVTFMPVYLQVVQGVSPSSAGLALTPLMGGMLVTSIGSGRLISRSGRYRIFPIIGTALMGLGVLLMAGLGTDTPAWVAGADMLVVGLGIGLVMQVMVLAVQNAADYRNLGVATSGVTLFRSIGGALGVAGAGAIFAAGLASGLVPNLPVGSYIVSDPAHIQALPDATREIYRDAYTGALHPVFLVSAVIAALGFVLTLMLREVPLRDTVGDEGGAGDLADSFAMPRQATSLQELERIIANAVSRDNRREALRRVITSLDVDLSPEEAWVLLHISRIEGSAGEEVLEIGDRTARGDAAERLLRLGLLEQTDDGSLMRTAKGRDFFSAMVAAYRARLSEIVAQWEPENHDEVRRLLTDFAMQLVADMPEPRDQARAADG